MRCCACNSNARRRYRRHECDHPRHNAGVGQQDHGCDDGWFRRARIAERPESLPASRKRLAEPRKLADERRRGMAVDLVGAPTSLDLPWLISTMRSEASTAWLDHGSQRRRSRAVRRARRQPAAQLLAHLWRRARQGSSSSSTRGSTASARASAMRWRRPPELRREAVAGPIKAATPAVGAPCA